MDYRCLEKISDEELLNILLKKLSDEDLLRLLEAVTTAVNLRFFLCNLADGCEFNITLKLPKGADNVQK